VPVPSRDLTHRAPAAHSRDDAHRSQISEIRSHHLLAPPQPATATIGSVGTDPVLWKERLGVLIERGVAIIVATCDDTGKPALTRGWGLALGNGDAVLLAVTARPGSRTARHLVAGAELSITVSEMTTYSTVQLQGTIDDVTQIDNDAQRRVDAHLDRFAEDAAKVGVMRNATSVFLDDLVLVRLTVFHAAEQTPGDRAGTSLERP
jgi:hypothetical protein